MKRRLPNWLLAAVLLAIALSSFLIFNLIVQLRFLIHDELQVELSPVQSIVHTNSNELSLNFTVGVRTFRFCRARCSLSLEDPYSRKILHTETVELSARPIVRSYSINLNMSGAGERLFYYYVSCRNEPSLLCKTRGRARERSALVTVERNYTLEEFRAVLNAREAIEEKYVQVWNASFIEGEYNRLVDALRPVVEMPHSNRSAGWQRQLNASIDAYMRQNLSGALSLLNFSPVAPPFYELLENMTEYNSNLRHILSANMSLAYDYLVRVNDSRAATLNRSYSFNDLVSPDPVFLDMVEGLPGILAERNRTEWELRQLIGRQHSLLSQIMELNLTGDLCRDLLAVANATDFHNSHLLSGGDEAVLTLINSSIYDATENETHIIVGNRSIEKDAPLAEYLSYLAFPEVPTGYCMGGGNLEINLTPVEFEPKPLPVIEPRIGLPYLQCCIYGTCSPCSVDPGRYPILFVHGHSLNKNDPPESSIHSFSRMQRKMAEDELVVNGGDIDYLSAGSGYWSRMPQPVGVRATYYILSYYDANSLKTVAVKEEGIENYAIRLKELIDLALNRTGADKVIIVAHSMGGLVAREYLQLFGEDRVDRLIMIGTPNHGVSERIARFCGYLGSKRACRDMTEGSIFLNRLNSHRPNIPVYVILGSGCDTDGRDGDGIVSVESGRLPYANVTIVEGRCEGPLGARMHSELLDPDRFPGVYRAVRRIIFG